MKPKRVPLRMCTGCREMKPKKELIRVVKSPAGEISADFTGKKPGRGAYICPDAACLAKARKSKALERAFECKISDEVYAFVEAALASREAQTAPDRADLGKG